MGFILLTETTRTAHKNYRCIHCGEIICEREEYVYTSGAVEGTIQVDYWHPECRQAVRQMLPEDWNSWTAGTNERP